MPAPKPAIPNPAATLPGEADILANVVANLADDHAKLVYADWLEDRDDPRGPLLRNFVTAYRAGKKLPAVKSAPQPWRDLVGITLIEQARPALARHTDTLLRLARPASTFEATQEPGANLEVGASKLGGLPDMPAEVEWPVWTRGTLAFLAQFNLTDLVPSVACRELPAEGLLSVFYDSEGEAFEPSDIGGWRVFHFPDVLRLARREPPRGLAEAARFRSAGLTFTETLTLPCGYSPWDEELALGDGRDAYGELLEPGMGHRLLGYAHPCQNDVYGQKGIRHLLTIDSDDAPGWMWGDAGLLYFTMAEADLQQHKFDRVRMEMQCG